MKAELGVKQTQGSGARRFGAQVARPRREAERQAGVEIKRTQQHLTGPGQKEGKVREIQLVFSLLLPRWDETLSQESFQR